ncbi:MAG: hypothetical protein GOVbin152_32 [Prokaryotic dsDNA virus sp.]|nr:MAG: hypothetical protein GOVbin152_32 [Prokaryotic dsDNA virus sp.]|tara:strand:- start:5177 stop:5458 length:282 start_codon:yes stop_codon:yes gene_type:complete
MTYKFKGDVIRLSDADFERWQNAYQNIPNLTAYLNSRDAWLQREASNDQRKRWFLSTAAYLAKVDANFAKENKRDEQGRRVDADGKAIFKTQP